MTDISKFDRIMKEYYASRWSELSVCLTAVTNIISADRLSSDEKLERITLALIEAFER